MESIFLNTEKIQFDWIRFHRFDVFFPICRIKILVMWLKKTVWFFIFIFVHYFNQRPPIKILMMMIIIIACHHHIFTYTIMMVEKKTRGLCIWLVFGCHRQVDWMMMMMMIREKKQESPKLIFNIFTDIEYVFVDVNDKYNWWLRHYKINSNICSMLMCLIDIHDDD